MADTPAAAPGPPQQAPPQQTPPQQEQPHQGPPPPHQPRRPAPPRPPAVRHPSSGPVPQGRGPRPPADPATTARAALAARRSNAFVLLALASLVVGSLPLPWGIAGIALGVAALVLGLMAVITAMDARLRAGRLAVLWVSLAVVAVVVLIQLARLVAYPRIVEDQDCRREAITLTAQAACSQRSGLAG